MIVKENVQCIIQGQNDLKEVKLTKGKIVTVEKDLKELNLI